MSQPPPLGPEIRRSLIGALRLSLAEPAAMDRFNRTMTGFWRSFLAVGLACPAVILIAYSDRMALVPAPPFGTNLAYESTVFLGRSVAFPVVVLVLVRLLGLRATYVPFVIAHNWSTVWVTALMLPSYALFGFGLWGGDLVWLAAATVVACYRWIVARIALATGWLVASGVVMIDVLVAIGVELVVRQVFYGGFTNTVTVTVHH